MLGALLIRESVIDDAALEAALEAQKHTGRKLGVTLIEAGKLDEETLARFLALQAEVPYIGPARFVDINREIADLVDPETADRFGVVPVAIEDGQVVVACADPGAFSSLGEVAHRIGKPVRPGLATRTDIANALSDLYGIAEPTLSFDANSTRQAIDDAGLAVPPPGDGSPEMSTEVSDPGALLYTEDEGDEFDDDDEDPTLKMSKHSVQSWLDDFKAQKASDEDNDEGTAENGALEDGEILAAGDAKETQDEMDEISTLAMRFNKDEIAQIRQGPVPVTPDPAPIGNAYTEDQMTATPGPLAPLPVEELPAPWAPPRAEAGAPPMGIVRREITSTDPHSPGPAVDEVTATSDSTTEQLPPVPVAAPPPVSPLALDPLPELGASGGGAAAGDSGGQGFSERYQFIDKLGTGGMAEVWRARMVGAEGFRRMVVVKKILPEHTSNREFVEMFIDEARIASRLSHPNIAQIYEFTQEEGQYYLAMEYVDGPDLMTIFERTSQADSPDLPFVVAAYVVERVCDALDYAHRKTDDRGHPLNIIHRDVTPHNVIVSYDGHVKVIDFGIAKAAQKMSVTRVGYMKGKPGYIAPEQALGMPLDSRLDVFAAGIMLFELICGERLFPNTADAQALSQLAIFDARPLLRWKLRIPGALRASAIKALRVRPEDRFQSAAEMGKALRHFIRRHSEDPRDELSKFVRDHLPPEGGWQSPTG